MFELQNKISLSNRAVPRQVSRILLAEVQRYLEEKDRLANQIIKQVIPRWRMALKGWKKQNRKKSATYHEQRQHKNQFD